MEKRKKIPQSALIETNPQIPQSVVVSATVWVHFSECVKAKNTTKLLYRKLGVKIIQEYCFSIYPKWEMYKSSTWTRWILELMNTDYLVWCSLGITILSKHLFRLLEVGTQLSMCLYWWKIHTIKLFFSIKGLNLLNHSSLWCHQYLHNEIKIIY